MGSVFRTAVPSILLLESETELHFHNANTEDIELSTGATQLLKALEQYGKLNLSDVVKLELSKSPYKIAQELLNHDLIHVREEVYTKFKPKQQKQLALASSYEPESALQSLLEELNRFPKQRETLLQLIQQKTSVQKSEFLRMTAVSKSAVETLIKKGVLDQQTVVVDRLAIKTEAETPLQALTTPQQQALASLRDDRNQTNRFLLHGVTASGKTEVYMHLIQEVIQQGKQVLFLVPEIALTTQIIQRLYVHFGKSMAVYHSRYTPSERVEVWKKVLRRIPTHNSLLGRVRRCFCPFQIWG